MPRIHATGFSRIDGLWLVIGILIIVAIASAFAAWNITPANSQEQDRGAWFKSLAQPDTGLSCCDISDCARAIDPDWKAGQWWARVEGQMTPIPNEKVVRNPPSIDGDAYVCANPNRHIYCFIPPSPGS